MSESSSRLPARSIETRVVLDAPRDEVWAVLMDVERYPSWNPGLRFPVPFELGARVVMRINLGPMAVPIPVKIASLEPPHRLSWRGGPPGLMEGHHYFELHPLLDDPNRTELIHGERFTGLLTPVLWPLLQRRLQPMYRAINDGLRERFGA